MAVYPIIMLSIELDTSMFASFLVTLIPVSFRPFFIYFFKLCEDEIVANGKNKISLEFGNTMKL